MQYTRCFPLKILPCFKGRKWVRNYEGLYLVNSFLLTSLMVPVFRLFFLYQIIKTNICSRDCRRGESRNCLEMFHCGRPQFLLNNYKTCTSVWSATTMLFHFFKDICIKLLFKISYHYLSKCSQFKSSHNTFRITIVNENLRIKRRLYLIQMRQKRNKCRIFGSKQCPIVFLRVHTWNAYK